MIVWDDQKQLGRDFSRKGALGLKQLEIAPDVEQGNEVKFNFDFENRKIILEKADDLPEEEKGNAEILIVTDEIGLFGYRHGIKTTAEIVFCDGYMLFNVTQGAIIHKFDGNPMLVGRGLDYSKIPSIHMDSVKWLSVDDVLSFCKVQLKDRGIENYVQDFIFTVEMYGGKDETYLLSFTPKSDPIDISGGIVERRLYERQLKEEAKQAKALVNQMMAAASKPDNSWGNYAEEEELQYEDEVDNPYGYDDFDDDDDFG